MKKFKFSQSSVDFAALLRFGIIFILPLAISYSQRRFRGLYYWDSYQCAGELRTWGRKIPVPV
jgi:hypothetical protein